jgi:hypothetical protein
MIKTFASCAHNENYFSFDVIALKKLVGAVIALSHNEVYFLPANTCVAVLWNIEKPLYSVKGKPCKFNSKLKLPLAIYSALFFIFIKAV